MFWGSGPAYPGCLWGLAMLNGGAAQNAVYATGAPFAAMQQGCQYNAGVVKSRITPALPDLKRSVTADFRSVAGLRQHSYLTTAVTSRVCFACRL